MVYLKIKKSNWNQNSSINLQNSERELKGTIQCVYQESIMGIELKQYNFFFFSVVVIFYFPSNTD